ncbi:unnamed protein product [Rotaria sp. Silwood2]|nr:unnamed protein product [Rotaria sp. Silwood2]CAF2837585.1 unnamed protein product [Rotaria sp. Silwood2]CAF2999935.1 unnamed protein product [Rotaria sp. Silwood2]CAF3927541.1 unnamed protein product [Rotaria sp. Silwood2]CAF4059914.1 unnamed protein product [Rotaria sp. Silwood2]
MYIQVFIFFIICPFIHIVISSSLPSPELHIKYGGQALTALQHLLTFFESDVNDLNLDGLYGLRIAQGQLDALHEILTSTSNENHHLTDKNKYIHSLSQQIERIANKSLTILAEAESSYLQRFILIASEPFRVEYEVRKIKKNLFEHDLRSSDFDENESDSCFAQLLGSNNPSNSTKCFITQSCWNMMTSSMTKDYRLTHQLLWFLVAKNVGCIDNRLISNIANKNLKYLEDRYCSNIYQDAEINIKDDSNQDLFLEELLLCSIIGYEEFLRFDWFNTILTWQDSEYGCFPRTLDTIESNSKMKRHLLIEQNMVHGCLSHQSGLAAGLLATYARAFLQ